MKRAFDLAGATLLMVLLLPVWMVLAALVGVTSRGGVFHRARRVGRAGVPFTLYKFRTMRIGISGPAITAADDPRVTVVGKWLRRTKLDELPQLLNVVRGDMSLVGPRPEDPRYVEFYTPDQRRILRVRPGITSAASLAYRNEEAMLTGPEWETRYREEVMPAKIAIDLEYLESRSFLSDLRLIARTALTIFQ